MIKHFLKTNGVVKRSLLNSNFKLLTSKATFASTFAQSKYTQPISLRAQTQYTPGPDRSQFKISREIPDFDASSKSTGVGIDVSVSMSKEKHPLEYVASIMRQQESPFTRMNERTAMITNFPANYLVNERSVMDLVIEADPSAQITNISITNTVPGNQPGSKTRPAYALVEFLDQASVRNVQRVLSKKWVQEKLMKVRTIKDEKRESFSDRTLIVSNLKSHWRREEIANAMHKFGAITHIEMPSLDTKIKASVEHDQMRRQHLKQQEIEYRYSQKVLSQSLLPEMEQLLKETIGEEQATQLKNTNFTNIDILDEHKLDSFKRVLAHLQQEGIQIENSKASVQSVITEINQYTSNNSVSGEGTNPAAQIIKGNKAKIEQTLKYILGTQQALSDQEQTQLRSIAGGVDPLHELQRMSMSELTRSYDFLLSILTQREALIKTRLKESVKFYQRDERVLFEKRDFTKEQEHVADVVRNILRYDFNAIDQVLGVDEQVVNIEYLRNMKPEDKLYYWLTDTAPFHLKRNFNDFDLSLAKNPEFDMVRYHEFQDTYSRSIQRQEGPLPSSFTDEAKDVIDSHISRAEQEYQTPFDELYHKEKKLVQDIVALEQQIKQLQDQMPDPAAYLRFDPLQQEVHEKYGNLFEDLEPQYLRDKRLKERQLQMNHLTNLEASEDPNYIYQEQSARTIQDLISSGQLKKSEYELAKATYMDNRSINIGYAFVTFSLADEAKQAMLLTEGELIVDNEFVEIMPKNTLDHSQMDRSYFMRKIMNEAKVVNQSTELREANTRLRDFERNINDELPSLRSLKDFKSLAQEIIENKAGKTRRHGAQRRTQREIEELYHQLKEYQAANPTMDLTSLFENYQADRARLNMHKRALQSYKQFSFLKVKPEPVKPTKVSDVYEPFNFPPLNDSVSKLFVDGIQPKIANAGNNSHYSSTRLRKGRQFTNYNHQDFLEAYLGKDYTGTPDLTQDPYNETFGFNERIKDMFPDEKKYLKMPRLKEERQKLRDFFGMYKQDGQFKDAEFGRFLAIGDLQKFLDECPREVIRHPTDPSRDYMSDLVQKYQEVTDKAKQRGKKYVNGFELKSFIDNLKQEYESDTVLYDDEGTLINARIDELNEKFQKTMEEMDAKFNEPLPQLSKEELDQQLLEFAKKNYPHLVDKMTDDVEEQVEEYVSDGEEEFEKQSMFAPTNQEQNNKSKKQKKQQQPKKEPVKQGELVDMFDMHSDANSKLKIRQSNENLYNISHLVKNHQLVINTPQLKTMQETADQVTDHRMKMFNTLKAQQQKLPVFERKPFKMGKNGIPVPYSQHEIQTLNPNQLVNVLTYQDYEVVPKCTLDELLKSVKAQGSVDFTFDEKDGQMFKYQFTQMDETDVATHNFRKQTPDQSLSDFVKGSSDLYSDYQEQSDTAQKIEKSRQTLYESQRFNQLLQEAKENLIQTPSFEEFFESQANNENLYDRSQRDEQTELDEEISRNEQDQLNDQLYKRELVARLFGGNITPRQLAVLTNIMTNEEENEDLSKAVQFRTKQQMKDVIRNAEELLESRRRKMVVDGKWKEHESHRKLQEELDLIYEKYPTDTAFKIAKREHKKQMRQVFDNGYEKGAQEREYYFDEGLGQSLADHVQSLQSTLKHAEVSTRRDGDGLPIVKITTKRNFKYSLDDFLNIDQDQIEKISKETQESILKHHNCSSNPKMVMDMVNGKVPTEMIIDINKKQLIEGLMHQRYFGKYRDDLAGFMKEYSSILNMPNTSEPATMQAAPNMNPFTVEGRRGLDDLAFTDLLSNKAQLDEEIAYQLYHKMHDKLHREKRQAKDFIKPAMSENLLYRQQVTSLEETVKMIERDNEWVLNAGDNQQDGEGFNVAEYKKLKQQIKLSKDTKERLIASGFPEFKAYTAA